MEYLLHTKQKLYQWLNEVYLRGFNMRKLTEEINNLNSYFLDSYQYFTSHVLLIFYNIIILLMIMFVVSLFIAFIVGEKKGSKIGFPHVQRVLLVTAHPDDECMFFGPVILHLVKSAKLYLICLSSGNYYGEGHVRKEELWESCKVLGINPNNVHLYKHDLLLDDPIEEWNPEIVGEIILNYIETLAIDTVISFDGSGVSGHKNHISIYEGLKYLKNLKKFPESCECFVLDSISITRKFLGIINILYDFPLSSFVVMCSYNEQQIIKLAMTKHVSQYVWFRKLFMFFSRYTYINSFSRTR